MTTTKRKILHLITGLELGGGAENMLLQLLPKMQDAIDNRVCVIKGRGEIAQEIEKLNIVVYYLDLKSCFDFSVINNFQQVIKDFRPDIQVNYLIHADIFGRIFGKIFGVKIIISYIRNIHKKKNLLMFIDKFTLGLSDFVLVNSETAKKYYTEKMGVDKNKIRCIPNAIDISRFESIVISQKEKLKELGISGNKFIIGCVARLEEQKDIPTLIKAFHLFHQRNPEAYLIIVGHGKEKEGILNIVKELGLEKEITFLENRRDMLEIYRIIDVFVLPSIHEGMSNALLEAMASKLFIISSDIEENKELIKNNINGFNFRVSDEKDLALKLTSYIENKITLSDLRNRAFLYAKNNYDINKVVRDYSDFLLGF